LARAARGRTGGESGRWLRGVVRETAHGPAKASVAWWRARREAGGRGREPCCGNAHRGPAAAGADAAEGWG
jgi:hypothetical protein